jgi:hypothetical protein
MTFHPGDTNNPNPDVYVAHSQLFHDTYDGYVGRISKVGGPTLSTVTPVITGLPVSHHDHGINGIEFGDHGELYIMVGGVRDRYIYCCWLLSLPEFFCSSHGQSTSHVFLLSYVYTLLEYKRRHTRRANRAPISR